MLLGTYAGNVITTDILVKNRVSIALEVILVIRSIKD